MNRKGQAFIIAGLLAIAPALGYEYDPNDFAVEVVEYVAGAGVTAFTNPLTALGRPTVDTVSDGWVAPPGSVLPVVPVYAAWKTSEVVRIGPQGYLVLKFGHPVRDDVDNPFGKDLIVFGNAFQNISGSRNYLAADPATIAIGGAEVFSEPGVISVSQDGQNWFTFTMDPVYRQAPDFTDPNLPGAYGFLGDFFADCFAPTLGRVYDPNLPGWWGEPTDPTRPLDPAVLETDLKNTTLAGICRRYGDSAGGTALDISGFDLPVDPRTGRKWIQYVRFDNPHPLGGATTEIDAVADAACCGDWKRTCIEGDIDRDGRVDLADLMKLSANWLQSGGDDSE